MAVLTFPLKKGSKYYDFYVSFIKSIFEAAGEEVVLDGSLDYIVPAAFYVKINGKLAFIEMSDFPDEYNYKITSTGWQRLNKFYDPASLGCPVFKRSMRPNLEYSSNIYPLGPFYVADNKTSKNLRTLIDLGNIYQPKTSSLILNTNRVWGGAQHTRKYAFENIQESALSPEVHFDSRRMNIDQHYNRHGELLASLNISGAHYNSQDIGAPESMFLGCLVISNDFDILLPYNKRLEKGLHYIHVADNYNNITECLNFPYENREKAAEIAYAGHEALINTCSPIALVKWLEQVVENYYD
jgi:hypothetical protein